MYKKQRAAATGRTLTKPAGEQIRDLNAIRERYKKKRLRCLVQAKGSGLAVKRSRDLERRIDGFYAVCEKILLRTLIFGCFVLELGRFARWLLR
jgi:hypothetical protein